MVRQLETRSEVEREPEQRQLTARHTQLKQQVHDKEVGRSNHYVLVMHVTMASSRQRQWGLYHLGVRFRRDVGQ